MRNWLLAATAVLALSGCHTNDRETAAGTRYDEDSTAKVQQALDDLYAQVASLQGSVASTQAALSTAQSDLATTQADLAAANQTIAVLQSAGTLAASQISALQSANATQDTTLASL